MGGTGSRSICLTVTLRNQLFHGHDRDVVPQLLKAARGHDCSWTNAFDRSLTGIRRAGLDDLHVSYARTDDVYVSRRTVVLDGVGGNQSNAFQRLDQKFRVHELIREQGVIVIVES